MRYALAEIAADKAVVDALLQTSLSFNGTLDHLPERIFTLLPAERGAVLFNAFTPAAFRSSAPQIEMNITQEAMREFSAEKAKQAQAILDFGSKLEAAIGYMRRFEAMVENYLAKNSAVMAEWRPAGLFTLLSETNRRTVRQSRLDIAIVNIIFLPPITISTISHVRSA